MAEYGREQRKQESRAIANSETGSKQLKGFVDNRKLTCILQKNRLDFSRKIVSQFAFTSEGEKAKDRVCAITEEDPAIDSFDNATFEQWHPALSRINFNPQIRDYVIDNAPHDIGNPSWITCSYCNWEYPKSRIQVDHLVNWADYSLRMTTSPDLANAKAFEVYIGCNDPENLVASCDSCNASKGDSTFDYDWMLDRRVLANELSGF